jgi:hypothetical protein
MRLQAVLMLRLFLDGWLFAPKFLKGKTKMRLCKKYLQSKPGTCRAINNPASNDVQTAARCRGCRLAE